MRYLLCVLIFMSTHAYSEVYRYEYFSKFPFWESPIQPFKFSDPLTRQDAQKRIHIQVGYDKNNRIIDVQTRQGDQFKALGNFFDALYVHAVHTKVVYQGDQEIHQFYNRFGNRTMGWGDIWEKIYTKDERERYSQMTLLDRLGKPAENSWGIANYRWKHTLDGSIIEERQSLAGELKTHRPGFEFERIRLYFDEKGHLRLMQNIDEALQLIAAKSGASQYSYFYDSKGAFERWEIYDAKGRPTIGPSNTAGEFYTIQADGTLAISFFDQTGGPAIHWSGASNWQLKRDTHGNIIELSYLDEKNQPTIGHFNFSKISYQWDNKGVNLLSKTLLNPSNKPTLHIDGYSKTQYFYTPEGLLTEQHFFTIDQKLVVSKYEKAAIIRHQYDNKGLKISTSKHGVKGELLNEK